MELSAEVGVLGASTQPYLQGIEGIGGGLLEHGARPWGLEMC